MTNAGHDLAEKMRKRAEDLWRLPGQQAAAAFIEASARDVKMFADVHEKIVGDLIEQIANLQDSLRQFGGIP